MVKTYQLKQAFRLGGERFAIKDQMGNVDYHVEGTFMNFPKTFTVYDAGGRTVSTITKAMLSFLPRFEVEMATGQRFTLRKKLTAFRDRYEFDNLPLVVEGNIWDVNFTLKSPAGQVVATINKEIFRLTSTYQLVIYEEDFADLVVSLAVAIDYVESLENRS